MRNFVKIFLGVKFKKITFHIVEGFILKYLLNNKYESISLLVDVNSANVFIGSPCGIDLLNISKFPGMISYNKDDWRWNKDNFIKILQYIDKNSMKSNIKIDIDNCEHMIKDLKVITFNKIKLNFIIMKYVDYFIFSGVVLLFLIPIVYCILEIRNDLISISVNKIDKVKNKINSDDAR